MCLYLGTIVIDLALYYSSALLRAVLMLSTSFEGKVINKEHKRLHKMVCSTEDSVC